MRRLFTFLASLWVCSGSYAQLSFNHQHFSVEDGLSENNISVIFQDSRGFMWFGTYNGLNRFDGYRFKPFKTLTTLGDSTILENDHIGRIDEDIYGLLWIVTYDGKVYRLDTESERFTAVTAGRQAPPFTHLHALSNGEVWLYSRDQSLVMRAVTDPETFEITCSLLGTAQGLPPGEIRALHGGSRGTYVLTAGGLVRFDPAKNAFEAVDPEPGVVVTVFSVRGSQLLVGLSNGSIWWQAAPDSACVRVGRAVEKPVVKLGFPDSTHYIAYYDRQGIAMGDLQTGEAVFRPIPEPYRSRLTGDPPRMFIDSFGEVWLSDGSPGILHFYPGDGKTEWLTLPMIRAEGFSRESDFFETPDGTLFVRLWGSKGCYYDRGGKRLLPIFAESGNEPFTNTISRWFADRQGNIWISSYRKRLEKISIDKRLSLIRLQAEDNLEQNNIHSLLEERNGRVWLGTWEGRICLMDADCNPLGYLDRNGRLTERGEIWPRIYAMEQDDAGDLWLGTRGFGLFRLREERAGNFRVDRFLLDSLTSGNMGRNHIFDLHRDRLGRIWIGTWGGGVGRLTRGADGEPDIRMLNPAAGGWPADKFLRIRHIVSDSAGRIWCASPDGVIVTDGRPDSTDDPRTITLTSAGTRAGYLPVNNVNSILRTTSDDIFIGTTSGGLYRVVQQDGEVLHLKNYNSLTDFPSDIIYSMTEGPGGELWIATPAGIVRFDPDTEETRLYGNDHFDPYTLTSNTAMRSAGRILLGSNKGLVAFDTGRMGRDSYVPPLYFTRLQLFHKNVEPGDESRLLKHPLSRTDRLVFNHRQSVFSMGFAALDFRNPVKIRYRYMLEGFDREWLEADASRNVSYTNLSPGEYVFKVRSTNSDGVWVDNERRMGITVLPPFWKTPLAYLLYVLLSVALIWGISYVMYTVYRLKHTLRMDREMMRVFTNISHEIRTPLTLVHTPLEHLLKTRPFDEDTGRQLNIVLNNSGRLLQLVNQLLDFRKIQHGRMPLTLHPVAISELLHDLVQNFRPLAEQNGIRLDFGTNCPEAVIETDREKIETIFYNLISNAVKYTPAGKSISVGAMQQAGELRFTVRDEGVGMSRERMSRLFTPFESGERGPGMVQPGTGIGLTLVRELCRLLNLTIHFESHKGAGTTVTLILAVDDAAGANRPAVQPADVLPAVEALPEAGGERKKILVAEDNPELRDYLRRILATDYEVVEAGDGKQALEQAQKDSPDLILSDLMMPEMDGIAFAEALKTEIRTSHIPIVILTAKNDDEIQNRLFELGVDAFVTKPFNSGVLLTQIAGILRQREQLYAIYSTSLEAITRRRREDNRTSAQDQACLEQLMAWLEANLSTTDIAVEDLCAVSGFNYFLLNKKLKALIGLSPLELIREFRIQRAAQLIVESRTSMKEIAYRVGFSDSRYFSKCFKKKYGVTPSEYKAQIQGPETGEKSTGLKK